MKEGITQAIRRVQRWTFLGAQVQQNIEVPDHIP